MTNDDLQKIAEWLGYTAHEHDDKIWVTKGLMVNTEWFDPTAKAIQLLEVMNMFQYIAVERPGLGTWVVDARMDLQDPELITVISNKSMSAAILKAALKVM